MKDKPLEELDRVSTGTVSLKGKIILGVINDEQIDRWKGDELLPADFNFSPFVAFSKPGDSDYTDLKYMLNDHNGVLIYHSVCVKLLDQLSPAEFVALCRRKGLDSDRVRVVIVPEDADCPNYIGRVFKRDTIEIGSFSYDGNLTIKLLGPYKAMEAKRYASKSGSTGT